MGRSPQAIEIAMQRPRFLDTIEGAIPIISTDTDPDDDEHIIDVEAIEG